MKEEEREEGQRKQSHIMMRKEGRKEGGKIITPHLHLHEGDEGRRKKNISVVTVVIIVIVFLPLSFAHCPCLSLLPLRCTRAACRALAHCTLCHATIAAAPHASSFLGLTRLASEGSENGRMKRGRKYLLHTHALFLMVYE